MSADVLETAYQYACGKHMDLIFDKKLEEHLRKEDDPPPTQTPTGKSGRDVSQDDDPNRIPDPSTTPIASLTHPKS
jgi:hypothetical protein